MPCVRWGSSETSKWSRLVKFVSLRLVLALASLKGPGLDTAAHPETDYLLADSPTGAAPVLADRVTTVC